MQVQAKDAESAVAEFFGSFEGGGGDAVRFSLKNPLAAIRMQSNIGRLPTVEARLVADGDSEAVLQGLLRPHRFARRMVRGTTAVLALTEDYLQGSSESKRSLRTKYHRGTRRGFRVVRPQTLEEKRAYLQIANDFERTQPHEHYRNENPQNDYLLEYSNWMVAVDAEGTPLILTVPTVSGEWAVLQHFKTLAATDDARLARFWMSVELVQALRAMGVGYIADSLSPIGLPPGLRDFQRRLGYRLVRVKIVPAAH